MTLRDDLLAETLDEARTGLLAILKDLNSVDVSRALLTAVYRALYAIEGALAEAKRRAQS